MKKLILGFMFMAVLIVAGSFVPIDGTKTAQADCFIDIKLASGSVHHEVRCLQGIIGVSPDGHFGPMTLTATKNWQAVHGLTADGIVGPNTRYALNVAQYTTINVPAGGCTYYAYSSTSGIHCQ